VLGRLRPEFPDVTISKLRFLEAEGLVQPHRAPSGYRKYSAADLDRLRFVLIAQRDRYLPLRVIREQLTAADQGVTDPGVRIPDPVPPGPVGSLTGDNLSGESGELRLTRAELAERSGLQDSDLRDLDAYGLLPTMASGRYGDDALTVAQIAARLFEYGLQARHLRPYRTTAEREVGLFAQLVPTLTHQGGEQGRTRALETVHELAELCALLHAALIRDGLRRALGG
jgi:DNA-binding transcriptional MerR regulator